MESLFKDYSEQWLGKVNSKIKQDVDSAQYWFKSRLTPSYSVDMEFSSISGKNTNVTADVVSMDSELPLKSRSSITSFKGEIPKIGMQKYLNERQRKKIQVLEATGVSQSVIVKEIFDDYKSCTIGAYEKLELMFLQALSTGITEVGADINTGRSVRVDFGIPAANKFGASTAVWSDPAATPIDDIEAIVETAQAEGVNLQHILMDSVTFNHFKKNTQVKDFYASYLDLNASNNPTPNLDKVNAMLQANFGGLTITVVNRSFKVEISGTITTVKAWTEGAVSFYSSLDNLGELVWSDLAEKIDKVETKTYSYPEQWLMVTKERQGSPLREFTESSGLVMPVIHNVDQIYLLDSTTIQA